MALQIERILDSRFEFSLDGGDPISDNAPNLTTFGNICHFKTKNGANIIANQNVTYADVTVIDTFGGSGSFTFVNIQNLWTKLIELNFFVGVAGIGGGGATRFDALTDTFTYFGNDGKVPVVDEAQLELVATTFYNYKDFIQLDDVAIDTLIDGKIVGVALVEGTPKLVLTDPIEESDQFVSAVGGFYYADLVTQTTPLAYTTGDLQLTNDIDGALTFLSEPPYGITSVWDESTNTLDFTQLSIGDQISLRVDLIVTTSAANQTSEIKLLLGEATADVVTLLLEDVFTETAGATSFSGEISFQLNYENWRATAGKILFSSDASADIEVTGFNAYIIRKSVNILDITDNTFRTFTIAQLASPTVDVTALAGTIKIGYEGTFNKLTNILFGLEFSKYLAGVDAVLSTKSVYIHIYNKTKKVFFSAIVSSFTQPSVGYYNAVLEEVIDLADVAVNDELEINFDVSAAVVASPLTTKGDLLGFDTGLNRLPVGANGLVLTADSAEATGLKWSAVAGTGDVVGPASAVNENIAVFDTTTGKLIKDGLINKSAITANTAKVSNATHTGEVTGSGALTIDPTAISGKTLVTAVATDTVLLLDATDGALKKADVSDFLGGGGASLTQDVNQVSHGLAVGDAVKHNGTIWTKAQGTDITTAGCIGVVSAVADVDNFTYQFGGLLTSGTYTDGTAYFLSVATAGLVTTEPTYVAGNVRQYIGMGTPDGLLLEIAEGDEMIYEAIIIRCSDGITPLTAGINKRVFWMPYDFYINEIIADLVVVGSTSGTTTIDINDDATSILSTKLTIDFGEESSTTAATPVVISTPSIAGRSKISVDFDAITGGGTEAGLILTILGTHA